MNDQEIWIRAYCASIAAGECYDASRVADDALKAFDKKFYMENIFYTDYPIPELGDEPDKTAPMRECEVLGYDGDKYCTVSISHTTKTIIKDIKSGYIYKDIDTSRIPRY